MKATPGLVVPVAAMLAAQAVLSMATVTLPILAPAVAAETGLPFSLLGVFVALIYASSMGCGLVSGALVRRWGALRLSQLCLIAACAGVGLLASAHLLAAVGGGGMLEIDANPNPLRSEICGPLANVVDGHATLTDAPGLGIVPDLSMLRGLAAA